MTAAEARRGGKPGDLDPPMDVLKANWLREVDEIVEDENEPTEENARNASLSPPQMVSPQAQTQTQTQTQTQQQPASNKSDGQAPPTPTTPSTRSMAIDSIVDKVDAS